MTSHDELTFSLLGHKIKIYDFYNIVSNTNDIILALFFIMGSIDFLNPESTFTGTIFFLIGSIQLLVKPMISITKDIHVNIIRKKH